MENTNEMVKYSIFLNKFYPFKRLIITSKSKVILTKIFNCYYYIKQNLMINFNYKKLLTIKYTYNYNFLSYQTLIFWHFYKVINKVINNLPSY